MNKLIETRLHEALKETDQINDRLFLAVSKTDRTEIDRAGRDLVNIGRVIKDLAAEMGRGR